MEVCQVRYVKINWPFNFPQFTKEWQGHAEALKPQKTRNRPAFKLSCAYKT